jgi:hypothetical protein
VGLSQSGRGRSTHRWKGASNLKTEGLSGSSSVMRRELPRFSSRWKHTRRSIGGWRLTISDWKWRLELTIDESRALRCDGDSLLSLLQQRFPDDYSLSALLMKLGRCKTKLSRCCLWETPTGQWLRDSDVIPCKLAFLLSPAA